MHHEVGCPVKFLLFILDTNSRIYMLTSYNAGFILTCVNTVEKSPYIQETNENIC